MTEAGHTPSDAPPPGAQRVLLLGADGFIGRHIAFALRDAGHEVIACARRPDRLARMGFTTLRADLTAPATHDPGFWRAPLDKVTAVINAAGLLNGSERQFQAVHQTAPGALYAAMPAECQLLLISATGIETATTPFARHRRTGETLAQQHNGIVLRPGLVLGETSYGGSSLLRALAACPLVTPVVGDGAQPFNPIHAEDLAALLLRLLQERASPDIYAIGGPETCAQADMVRAYRSWLGLPAAPLLRLPLPLARLVGRIGDVLRLGPISATAVAQLTAGVISEPDPRLPASRPFSAFHRARPAGSQDLWHARLYLMRPVLRLTLALLWIASGLLGLTLPAAQFLPLISPHPALSDTALIALARLGGLADLAIALALLRGWRLPLMAAVQGALVLGYTLTFSLLAPALWLLPLGGLLKNLPILALITLHAILEDER